MTLFFTGASGDDPLAAGLEGEALNGDSGLPDYVIGVAAEVHRLYPDLPVTDPRFEAAVMNVTAAMVTRELGLALAPPPRTGPLPTMPGYAPDPRQVAA